MVYFLKQFLIKKIAEIQASRTDSQLSPSPIRKVNPAKAKREVTNELRD